MGSYLHNVHNIEHRKCMSKLRLSAHDFPIEKNSFTAGGDFCRPPGSPREATFVAHVIGMLVLPQLGALRIKSIYAIDQVWQPAGPARGRIPGGN